MHKKSDDDLMRSRDRARSEVRTKEKMLKGAKERVTSLKEQLDEAHLREQDKENLLKKALKRARRAGEAAKYGAEELVYITEENKTLSQQVGVWKAMYALDRFPLKDILEELWRRIMETNKLTKLQRVCAEISNAWALLPKEVKVSGYIACSYGIAEIMKLVSGLEFSSPVVAVGVNVLLVFLKELKPRIQKIRG